MDPLAALVDWVENGKTPATLSGERRNEDKSVAATRPICPYPTVARWNGQGNPDDGTTYECTESTRMPPAGR